MEIFIDSLQTTLHVALAALTLWSLCKFLGGVVMATSDPPNRNKGLRQVLLWFWVGLGSFVVMSSLFWGFRRIQPHRYRMFTNCRSNVFDLANAIGRYADDHHGHCPAKLEDLVPKYLRELPQCPAAKAQMYDYQLKRGTKPGKGVMVDTFTICCKGYNHTRAEIPADYPRYSSIDGVLQDGYR